MAKKLKQSGRIDLEHLVQYLYVHGVFQSFIINVSLLIVLTLITNNLTSKNHTPILLSFVDQKEIVEDFHELEEPETSIQIEESSEIDDVSEKMENVVSDIVDTKPAEIADVEIFETTHSQLDIISESEMMVVLKTSQPARQSNTRRVNIPQSPPTTNPIGNILSGDGSGALVNIEQDRSIGDLNQRLGQYGAKGGDVQVSLSWNTIDDIDLHVAFIPLRSNINWTRKVGLCGGILDIDMNAHPNMLTNRPIENVFWRNNMAPKGLYIVGIHNYMAWSRNPRTEVLVVVKIRGKVHSSQKVHIMYGQGVQEVTRFNFQ